MLAKLIGWFRPSPLQVTAERIYDAVVTQARRPEFYLRGGVPDTLDGRFEMLALHAFLVLRRLRADAAARELTQAVSETLFADMDRNLREIGVGDLGVGRKVKAMAEALYGRIGAYEHGLAAGDAALALALRRNLFGTVGGPDGPGEATLADLARYVRAAAAGLERQTVADLAANGPRFPAPDPAQGGIDPG